MIIYSLVITFLFGISVGYSLYKTKSIDVYKKEDVKKIKNKNFSEQTINTSINKPFVIEDLQDDVIPKIHEEIEVAK